MTTGEITAALDGAIDDWYERQRTETGVNRNVMTVGLIMCEHMETHFPLDEARWFWQARAAGRAGGVRNSHEASKPLSTLRWPQQRSQRRDRTYGLR